MPRPTALPILPALAAAALALAAAPTLDAQAPASATAADSALAACIAASSANQAGADATAANAERLFQEAVRARPEDPAPLVGLAQVKARCRIPLVPMMTKAALLDESNALYERALALDPEHWEARFFLAVNHFYTPDFLGRTPDAIRELELLIAQQGGRGDPPAFAQPYLFLGDLYARTGDRARAEATWRAGAALFPGNPAFAAKLAGAPRGN